MQRRPCFRNIKTQHGNALFLILIAVALFAALSYAITQSGRGGGSVDKETATIAASQLTQQAADLQLAIQRMILSGVSASNISFNGGTGLSALTDAPCDANPEYCVFSPQGGGATDQPGPTGLGGDPWGGPSGGVHGSVWGYYGILSGTDNGYYIADVGTNTNVSGREVFASIYNFGLTACQQINKGLGIDTTPLVTSRVDYNSGMAATYDAGSNTFDAYPGQPFACVNDPSNGPDMYGYYHALIEQ